MLREAYAYAYLYIMLRRIIEGTFHKGQKPKDCWQEKNEGISR